MALNKLYLFYMAASLKPHHFIVPELGHLIHEFKYSKVPYGPLTVEKARKCLYTLLVKINSSI